MLKSLYFKIPEAEKLDSKFERILKLTDCKFLKYWSEYYKLSRESSLLIYTKVRDSVSFPKQTNQQTKSVEMAVFLPSSSSSIFISSLDTRRTELHKIRKKFRFSKPVRYKWSRQMKKETFEYLLICFCIMMNIKREKIICIIFYL